MRIVFTAYWLNAAPSTEIFYVRSRALQISVSTIKVMEQEIRTLMQTWVGHQVERVIYIGYGGVQMTAHDETKAGWHMLTQQTAFDPVP